MKIFTFLGIQPTVQITVLWNKVKVLNELLLATITFRFFTLQQIFSFQENIFKNQNRPDFVEQCSRIKRIVSAGDQEIQITRPLFGFEN